MSIMKALKAMAVPSAPLAATQPEPEYYGPQPYFGVGAALTGRCTGSYSGGDHVLVLMDDLHSGRLHRVRGDALCKPRGKFWGLMKTDRQRVVTCKRCIELAEAHALPCMPPLK